MRPGDVVADRFTIDKLAGSGGMGAIYRARDTRDGAWVALKILQGEGASDRARFEREASVLADLSHPAIVRYVARGTTPLGQPYLAMEWLDGEDLSDRLALSRLSAPETMTLGRSVAEALAVAHARGVVHRDIKPSNLFLVGGDIRRVKLLDFGIARLSRGVRLSSAGAVLGTPAYMAPEQARGDRDLDARVDVFALGCVLFECLTGRKPFEGTSPLAVLGKILLEEAPRVRELLSDVPAAVDELCARMLSKDPRGRPRDGARLAEEMATVSLSPPPPRASATTPRPARITIPPDEQLLVSVILVSPTEAQERAERPFGEPLGAPLREAAERAGARLDALADGSAIALLTGQGNAADLAAQAARCALALRASASFAPIALSTARGVYRARLPIGEAIDRAAALLEGKSSGSAEARSRAPVRLDDVTAGMLDARFDVRVVSASGTIELHSEREPPFGEARALLGRPSRCVGREREIEVLNAALDECISEPIARAVLLTGAPGAGKSRLLHEILRDLGRRAASIEVWMARGDALSVASPLGMVAELVCRAVGLQSGEPLPARREKLRARVGRHVPITLSRRVAEFLGELSGTPFPDESSAALHAARNDARLMGDQMRQAFEDLVAAECAAHPLIIVLEDLHWGDLPSVQFLDAILCQLRDRPLMVFALARPDVHDLFPKLWAGQRTQELRLAELPRRAGERLVRDALGEDLAAELVEQLLRHAEGNVFHLEELIRATAEGRRADLPLLLLVQARLAALPPSARRVLRAASVFGQVFWASGVTSLLGQGTRPGATQEWLDDLARREVVAPRGEGRFPGEQEYMFQHTLIRDAAYAMLAEEDQRVGHHLAAAWLTQAGELSAAVLAEHHERGGEAGRAVGLYLRAAEQALAGDDFRAALGRARRGVACGAEGEQRGALFLVQAEANANIERNMEADACAAEAMRLLRRGSPRWFGAVSALGLINAKLGSYDRLIALSQELFRIEVRGAPDDYAICASNVAVHLFVAGQTEVAEHLLSAAEAAATAAPVPDPVMLAFVSRARGVRSMLAGDLSSFLGSMKESAEGFERAGAARSAIAQRANVARAYLMLGAYAAASAVLRDVLGTAPRLGRSELMTEALGREPGVPIVTSARHHLAMALALSGALSEALSVITAALASAVARKSGRLEAICRTYRATILLLSGDARGAAEEARGAVDIPTLSPPMRAYPLGVLARARLSEGKVEEALSAAEKAMALMRSSARIEEGEMTVAVAHVEALLAAGRAEAAEKALAAARDRLREEAGRIADPVWRESFCARVPENARILELARQMLKDEPPRRPSSF